jgi:hypothetical protein
MKMLNHTLLATFALGASLATSHAMAAAPADAWSPATLNQSTHQTARPEATSVATSPSSTVAYANPWSPTQLHPVTQDKLQSYHDYTAATAASPSPWLPSELARASQLPMR